MSSIGAASSGSGTLQQQISLAVAGKALDAARAQGDAAISLLQAAAELQKSANEKAAAAPGVGRQLDVNA